MQEKARAELMAKCVDYPASSKCPNFYKCKDDGETVQVGTSIKHLQRYCFYCMATPGVKKIGDVAGFTGRTPKWCPLGRDE
jgi:hypothetical protein